MSRAGYTDDYDCGDSWWPHIRYRGAVTAAFRGKRGQAFLQEMLEAMANLPEPKLIAGELETDGAVCAIGSVGKARGVDMSEMDPEDAETVAKTFNIAECMAREIVFINDDCNGTPESRFQQMRQWIESELYVKPSKDSAIT